MLIIAQFIGTDRRQPDCSLGFPEIEDRPFCIAETGYSDTQNMTRGRVQSWLTDGRGQVPSCCIISHIVDQNWLCDQSGCRLRCNNLASKDYSL